MAGTQDIIIANETLENEKKKKKLETYKSNPVLEKSEKEYLNEAGRKVINTSITGKRVITGIVQGIGTDNKISNYAKEQYIDKTGHLKERYVKLPSIKQVTQLPQRRQGVVQFFGSNQAVTEESEEDEFEALKKRVNIPLEPEPIQILPKAGTYNNDLDVFTGDILPNKDDITHKEIITRERFYSGLDIL